MKIKIFTRFVFALLLVCSNATVYASHIFGAELFYNYISESTYNVTLVLYGDCATPLTYNTLPIASPTILVFNGNTFAEAVTLTIQAPDSGVEVTPICEDLKDSTSCTNVIYPLPGIKKFVYKGNVTINTLSTCWRFRFDADGYARTSSITNINDASGTNIQMDDTLNNINGPNSSPTFNLVLAPFLCDNEPANYNPEAVSYEPSDSLAFFLVPARDGYTGNNVTYVSPATAAEPLDVANGSFSFNSNTGQLSFTPNLLQKSTVVYNVEQFRNGTLVGTCQREMIFVVLNCNNPPPEGIITNASAGTILDSTDFTICQPVGPFTFDINPIDAGGSNITVTSVGLPAGATYTVTGNGTPNPQGLFSWTTTNVMPGTYTFYLTYDDAACPLSSVQTQAYSITITPVPDVNLTLVSQPNCNAKGVLNINLSGQGSPWQINVLQDTDTVQTIDNITGAISDSLESGTYTIRVHSDHSALCYKDTTITLTGPPIAVFEPLSGSLSGCYGGKREGKAWVKPRIGDTATYIYTWTDAYGDILQSPTSNSVIADTLYNQNPGTYTVTLKKLDGCDTSFTITIVAPSDSGFLQVSDTGMCPHDTIKIYATGGISYHWQPDNRTYISDTTIDDPKVSPPTDWNYIVYATNASGCIDTATAHVRVFPNAVIQLPDSVVLYYGENYQFSPGTNCTTFNWFPPQGLSAVDISNPITSPEANTQYIVTGTTEEGCTAKEIVNVYRDNEVLLTLPNAFAPGNGPNSILKPIHRGNVILDYLRIFNRWGQMVYESSNLNEGWDGTWHGMPQGEGVFIYTMQGHTADRKILCKQGNITLIR